MNLKRALIICCVLSVIGIIVGLSLAFSKERPVASNTDTTGMTTSGAVLRQARQ